MEHSQIVGMCMKYVKREQIIRACPDRDKEIKFGSMDTFSLDGYEI